MVRWNAGTEHVKAQRQEAPSQALLLGINHLRRMNPVFGQEASCSGATVPRLFRNLCCSSKSGRPRRAVPRYASFRTVAVTR